MLLDILAPLVAILLAQIHNFSIIAIGYFRYLSRITLLSAHYLAVFELNISFNRLKMYNLQFKNWPNFTYSLEEIPAIAISFAEELGLTVF